MIGGCSKKKKNHFKIKKIKKKNCFSSFPLIIFTFLNDLKNNTLFDSFPFHNKCDFMRQEFFLK